MTDIITPQLSGMSLAELREVIRASISRRADEELIFTLEIGTALNAGRAHCENPDCGVPGSNPNQRFGKWVSETVSETPLADLNTRTASNYMAFAREFGHLPLSTAARIGRKHGYKLAHAAEDVKAAAVAQAEAGRPITPDDMDRWFSPPRTIPAQAARAAQVVEASPAPPPQVETAPAGELEALRAKVAELEAENEGLRLVQKKLREGYRDMLGERNAANDLLDMFKKELKAFKAVPITVAQADEAKVFEATKWEKLAKGRQTKINELNRVIARMQQAGAALLTEAEAKNIAAVLFPEGEVSKERKAAASMAWNSFRTAYFKEKKGRD
ncbi:hypothetical protein [Paracoccus sp. PAR01]|uniref:hypothetical protein n=1 Tax=Paracoccus sp. PAR01 TaxID=2769282 RepID=UPI00178630F1|nr:hypothetical protein [Paracoccus sp. PAR01]MBD9527844.1 hypothetical protein [Paracoccus sp. PAR01]